jgi:hypothetical protein
MDGTFDPATGKIHARGGGPAALLRWSGIMLAAASWLSAGLFGAYILAFYGGAVPADRLDQWNHTLPRLYQPGNPAAALAVGVHFIAGGILLMAGPLQLMGSVRARFPLFHRWLGRAYATSAAIAGAGGLIYILFNGTIGGTPMNIGFGLYGFLMVLAAVQAYRHARARRFETHRLWATRLFALAIGSWLYRMDYGFWSLLTGDAGHTKAFDGPFDVVMAFFFYLPNLALADLFVRARRPRAPGWVRVPAAIALAGATFFVLLGTYYFTVYYWVPGIVKGVTGRW